MVQRVHVVLEDDIDGGAADETVAFSLDGSSYEIDLSDKNAAKLREAFAPFVGHARKVTGGQRKARTKSATTTGDGPSASELREWAQANGYELSPRGRVPKQIREAYEQANA